MMTSEDIKSKWKIDNERTKKNGETGNLAGIEPESIKASFQIADVEKLQKSVKQRPWILNDQLIKLEKPDRKHLNTNISLENTRPKGVIRGCSDCDNCQKIIAHWHPEESAGLS